MAKISKKYLKDKKIINTVEEKTSEIIAARGDYSTLKERLNYIDENIDNIDKKKSRKFKPQLGFAPWFIDMSQDSLDNNLKNCVDGGIDVISLALHILCNDNNELYLQEDITTVVSMAKKYENNNIKIKNLKLHCNKISPSFKLTDEFDTKYIAIIEKITNYFKDFNIEQLIVLNEEEEIYGNVDKQTFILNCINKGKELGYKTGITTTNFYYMFTKVTDEIKNTCDILGINHYQRISNKEEKTTFQDGLNAWNNDLVKFYIKSLKQKYNKEIVITETGVQDNWCALINPGYYNWSTIKPSEFKAVSIYLYGMLETLKDCEELSDIYIWYSINNSETVKLLASYTKGVI